MNSTEAPERMVWAIKDLGSLVETADRIVRVRKALLDPRVRTSDEREQEQIENQRARVEMLEKDEEPNCLPSIILQGMGQGTLIWNGEKPDMHGIPTAEQRFADYAQKAIKAVYTEFDPGSAVVVDDDLRQVLTWKTTRPPCVQKLELMDATGKVLLDRPWSRRSPIGSGNPTIPPMRHEPARRWPLNSTRSPSAGTTTLSARHLPRC